jgi:hypothetical protein
MDLPRIVRRIEIKGDDGDPLDSTDTTQHYCCVMPLPKLVSIPKVPFRVLPPGMHHCSLDEIRARFAFNAHRQRLFAGVVRVVAALETAGCRTIYLDGGFASNSPVPSDFDGCWDPTGVDPHKLDPVLLDYSNNRAAQKAKYGGEMFISASTEAGSGKTFLDFFQIEKNTGQPKGIAVVTSIPLTVVP